MHCRYFLSFSIDTTVVPVYRATLSQRAAQKRGVGWGNQSTFAFKATCNKTVCSKQSCFWQGKKCVVLHYHWEILTKVYFRFFIKTLKNHIDLWKWASDDPFNKAIVSFYLTTLTFSTEMREKKKSEMPNINVQFWELWVINQISEIQSCNLLFSHNCEYTNRILKKQVSFQFWHFCFYNCEFISRNFDLNTQLWVYIMQLWVRIFRIVFLLFSGGKTSFHSFNWD